MQEEVKKCDKSRDGESKTEKRFFSSESVGKPQQHVAPCEDVTLLQLISSRHTYLFGTA
jgi:hypothetical protein